MGDQDTIVALASGTLPSGIAILRISGPMCSKILQSFVQNPPRFRILSHRSILSPVTGEIIDEGLVVYFPAPSSFTGEDCAEFHLHGSSAVVKKMISSLLGLPGVRLAKPGEFSQRAFENGKLDLLEIEGLGDLVSSETESQRILAIGRMKGSVSKEVESWRDELISCLVPIEAQLDFSDEGDIDLFDRAALRDQLEILYESFTQAIIGYGRGRIVREGFRVGLGGPPNVGKSSVLNYLANSEIAIVTPEAGTTRDIKEVSIDISGQLIILIDSAGVRETDSLAEKEGVRRAKEMLSQCDLVLWLGSIDVTESVEVPELPVDILKVANKSDLGVTNDPDIVLSCLSGKGFSDLVKVIQEKIAVRGTSGGDVVLSHLRDVESIKDGQKCLERALSLSETGRDDESLELVAEELRRALLVLQRLLGVVDAEDVLDSLFSGFCIGK